MDTGPQPPRLRRTRFVCVSDTHNTYPPLPAGDVLIHAGDLTNQGSRAELGRAVGWLDRAHFECKVVVAGNHDVTLDGAFCAQQQHERRQRGNSRGEEADSVRLLLDDSPSITYLNHEARTVRLCDPAGPRTTFKVFGSPYSPHDDGRGRWAFGYAPEDAEALWSAIPLDADVVVTHTPPKFHCDQSPTRGGGGGGGAAGCEALRRALWRVRPCLAVCGHIHEARGAQSVWWDVATRGIAPYGEAKTFVWEDRTGGTKKQFRIDRTLRSQRVRGDYGPVGQGREPPVRCERSERASLNEDVLPHGQSPAPTARDPPPFHGHEDAESPLLPGTYSTSLSQGGYPAGGPGEAGKAGQPGREETCIVNAAIMASSWPHPAGKRFNKPIIVDLDLPTYSAASGG